MKVRDLFILKILYGDGDEVEGSARGLAEKYGDAATVFGVETPATPSASNWIELISKSAFFMELLSYVQYATTHSDKVGLYVVAHGSGGTVGALTPQQLAELLPILGFGRIDKLCLIACNVQVSMRGETNPSRSQIDDSFVGKLCVAMKDHYRPMVAAWTGFVSVYYQGAKVGLYRGEKRMGSEAKKKAVGKKFIKTPPKGMPTLSSSVAQELRQQEKRVFQFDGGNVVPVPLDKWHDK